MGVSNEDVRKRCGKSQLSKVIEQTHVNLMGQILFNPRKTELRNAIFRQGSVVLEMDGFVRRVGRPRHNWSDQLVKKLLEVAGSEHRWCQATRSATSFEEGFGRM